MERIMEFLTSFCLFRKESSNDDTEFSSARASVAFLCAYFLYEMM